MHAKIDTTPTGFEPEVAERKAAELQAGDDDGWTYKARHGNGPFSFVDIYDEDGELVGSL